MVVADTEPDRREVAYMQQNDRSVRSGQSSGQSDETQEGSGHNTAPEVQTPDKPSQAEGDRETIEESIREKDEGGTQTGR